METGSREENASNKKAPPFELYGLALQHKHLGELTAYSKLTRQPIFVPPNAGVLEIEGLVAEKSPDSDASWLIHYAGENQDDGGVPFHNPSSIRIRDLTLIAPARMTNGHRGASLQTSCAAANYYNSMHEFTSDCRKFFAPGILDATRRATQIFCSAPSFCESIASLKRPQRGASSYKKLGSSEANLKRFAKLRDTYSHTECARTAMEPENA